MLDSGLPVQQVLVDRGRSQKLNSGLKSIRTSGGQTSKQLKPIRTRKVAVAQASHASTSAFQKQPSRRPQWRLSIAANDQESQPVHVSQGMRKNSHRHDKLVCDKHSRLIHTKQEEKKKDHRLECDLSPRKRHVKRWIPKQKPLFISQAGNFESLETGEPVGHRRISRDTGGFIAPVILG